MDHTAPDDEPTVEATDDDYPGDDYPGDGYPGDGYPGDGYPGDGYPGDGYPGDLSAGAAFDGEPQGIPAGLLDGLNDAQRQAVELLDGPVAVIAGPGSGKTRVLTTRIAALIASGTARPDQILAVTFTNKAAAEMKERTIALVGDQAARMWICTFHSLCARFLRIEADKAGLPRAFTILDTGDVRTVLREVHRSLGLPDDAAAVKASASAISRAKNGAAMRPDPHTARIADAYRQRLTRLGAVDFDDLLLRTADLLAGDADILARWQRRFTRLLVDEYQDTNPVQEAIITMLARPGGHVCVVGDADQAIYGFRSASPQCLTRFSETWPATRTVVLEENYRSTGAIVETCRSIIATNPALVRPQLRTGNATGDPVRLVVCDDDRDEARFVAREIAGRGGDTAVLFRTNAQTRVFEEALLQEGVPYAVVGALRFYERAEIKDALAWLRLLVNPADVLSLTRAAGAPRRGIGPKTLTVVEDLAAGGNLIDALARYHGRGEAAVADLAAAFAGLATAAASGPLAALRHILDGGLRDHVRRHGGDNAAERVENLDELLNAAADFEGRHPTGGTDDDGTVIDGLRQVELFLEQVALVSGEDHAGTSATMLLTAHAAKGKEFDTVYVVGVEENLFPHGRGGFVADEAEERRLLFVACSRARKTLTLTRARRRLQHGAVVENAASRFLDDLPSTVQRSERRGQSTLHPGGRTPTAGTRSDRWGRPGAAPNATRSPATSHRSPSPARPIVDPGPRLTPADIAAGTRVRHKVFGDGTIRAVSSDTDPTIDVRFDNGTLRQLRLSLAPLTLA